MQRDFLIDGVQESAAAEKVAHEQKEEERTLVDGPAQDAGSGGEAVAEVDAPLVSEVDGNDQRQPEEKQQLFLAAGQAQLPIVTERLVAAVVQDAAKLRRCSGQAARAEHRNGGQKQRECARHTNKPRPAPGDGLAPGQVIF